MDVIERIKDNFNKGYFGKSMPISELPEEFPAWTLKQSEWIGVAIPLKTYFPFSEKYAHMNIATVHDVIIGDEAYDILMITSDNMETRNEFATVCANFVDPGINGSSRISLVKDPACWWKRWKDLLGNVSSNKMSYAVLGELLIIDKLLSDGYHPIWKGIDHSTHDVETQEFSVEVKSTVSRYGYEATISSIYQMRPADGKPLYLVYTRFEESELGISIDDVVERLKDKGYPLAELENALLKAGLEYGCIARTVKYKVIEWKKYAVDNSFPAVTESSFKDNRIPENIIKFTYTIDLSGITGENLL